LIKAIRTIESPRKTREPMMTGIEFQGKLLVVGPKYVDANEHDEENGHDTDVFKDYYDEVDDESCLETSWALIAVSFLLLFRINCIKRKWCR
jgi:hypothetical protein